MHDEVFERLVATWDNTSWSVFGEVPSPVGPIDVLAIAGRPIWRVLASQLGDVSARFLDALSALQRGRRYRETTVIEKTNLANDEFHELAGWGGFELRDGLWSRTDLPSDHIRRLIAFEVKATGFPDGVVQAALRRSVATETWVVVPSLQTAARLGAGTWGLVEKCHVGMRTPDLSVLHPTTAKGLPGASVVNRIARAIYLGS